MKEVQLQAHLHIYICSSLFQTSEALKQQACGGAPIVVAVPQDHPQAAHYPTMYATMQRGGPQIHHRMGPTGDLIPDFVPPPPPMFENGVKPGLPNIKPPLPPGKPDKISVKGKIPGAKGEKKRESTV